MTTVRWEPTPLISSSVPIAIVGKPELETLAKALEGREDPRQLIPGDPDKPVLSLDSFLFEQFPEGTLDSSYSKA
jgi:hypothetical protein